jgi:hypothetical protein
MQWASLFDVKCTYSYQNTTPLFVSKQEVLGRTNSLTSLHKSTVNNLAAVVTMEHNPNPLLSKANLTTLNINNLKLLKLWDYCIEVPLNGITSVPNFMKMYVAVQKLLVGTHRPTKTQTDRQTNW